IDSAPWGDRDRTRPPLVDLLQTAIVRRRRVDLSYAGRTGTRLVDPLGLVDKDDVWYFLAGTPKGQRTFRVDRIVTATVTDLEAHRPADFELSTAWSAVVEEMERRRSLVSATVLVPAVHVHVLESHFG